MYVLFSTGSETKENRDRQEKQFTSVSGKPISYLSEYLSEVLFFYIIQKKIATQKMQKCFFPFQESFNFKLEETDLDMSCVKVIGMRHHAFPEKGKGQTKS